MNEPTALQSSQGIDASQPRRRRLCLHLSNHDRNHDPHISDLLLLPGVEGTRFASSAFLMTNTPCFQSNERWMNERLTRGTNAADEFMRRKHDRIFRKHWLASKQKQECKKGIVGLGTELLFGFISMLQTEEIS